MNYTEEQLIDIMTRVRNRFFLSAGSAALLGFGTLYLLRSDEMADLSRSAMLFCGFIVGFFVAGILLPQSFKIQLKRLRK